MRSGKVILGMLAGAATGSLLGILFSPEKGSDIRKKISEKSTAYKDSVKEKLNGIFHNVSGKYEGTKAGIAGFAKKRKIKLEK